MLDDTLLLFAVLGLVVLGLVVLRLALEARDEARRARRAAALSVWQTCSLRPRRVPPFSTYHATKERVGR